MVPEGAVLECWGTVFDTYNCSKGCAYLVTNNGAHRYIVGKYVAIDRGRGLFVCPNADRQQPLAGPFKNEEETKAVLAALERMT